jgi:hypothetical protein
VLQIPYKISEITVDKVPSFGERTNCTQAEACVIPKSSARITGEQNIEKK